MARVLATCDRCGDVEPAIAGVQVWLTTGDAGEFSFTCPICGHTTVGTATPEVVDLLVAGGAAFRANAGRPDAGDAPFSTKLDG